MQDPGLARGSDLMTASLEGYAFLKVAAKGKGLDNLEKMLSSDSLGDPLPSHLTTQQLASKQ